MRESQILRFIGIGVSRELVRDTHDDPPGSLEAAIDQMIAAGKLVETLGVIRPRVTVTVDELERGDLAG